MRNFTRRAAIFTFIILALQFFSPHNVQASSTIDSFVDRLYLNIQGRAPDASGKSYWVNMLSTNKLTAADVTKSFFQSPEFLSKNISNDQYIDILYNTLQNRTPDSSGKAYWIDLLSNGYSRLNILSQFIKSQEFVDLCSSYGINVGTIILTEPIDTNPKIVSFVTRFYQLIQNREPDSEGLKFYVNQLWAKKLTAADVAKYFIVSQEFTQKNVSDDEFIQIIYKALQNRTVDQNGLTYWTDLLNKSYSRTNILSQIVDSQEFSSLCASYSISPGKIILTDPIDLYPQLVSFVNRNYNAFLNRTPDNIELEHYVGLLSLKQVTAAEIADSIVSSDEFKNSQLPSSEYITRLYTALLGRSPDQDGLNWSLQMLMNGYSRRYLLAVFINSPEFTLTCKDYNISRGILTTSNKDIPYNGIVFGFTNTTVNFRSAPNLGTAYKVDSIPTGTKIVMIGRDIYRYTTTSGYQDACEFYQIRWVKGTQLLEGYVASEYIDLVTDDINNSMLGALSASEESNGDPGTISYWDSVGGASYGVWQLASKQGSLDSFLLWLKNENIEFYNTLDIARANDQGSFGINFDSAWKQIAQSNYRDFYNLQHKYAKQNYYDRLVSYLRANGDYDERLSSFAVRNVLWSTAIQHGVGGPLKNNGAYGIISKFKSITSIPDFITAIYDERSKVDIYFSSQPDDVKQSLINRFSREKAEALRIYNYELQYVNK